LGIHPEFFVAVTLVWDAENRGRIGCDKFFHKITRITDQGDSPIAAQSLNGPLITWLMGDHIHNGFCRLYLPHECWQNRSLLGTGNLTVGTSAAYLPDSTKDGRLQ
jgi:hypothetical protein